jgi:DNA (cytosine-5)-methyltransferase 1
MPITFGSLFAGIGGMDLGLERAGMECKWQVEIDDYASRVLAKHWPTVHREKDVRQCGAGNLENVDLIAAGFPCQDISYAGKGAGLKGERSGLFYEVARIVGEMGPRYVVLENVSALLTRGLDQVLGTLASLGYDAEWHCIPAAYVGAPHIRDRVFVLAYASGERAGHECRSLGGQEWATARTFQSKALRQRDGQIVPKGADSVCCNVSDTRCSRIQQRRSDRQIEQGSGVVGGVFWDGTPKEPVAEREALADTDFPHAQGQRQEPVGVKPQFRDAGYESWWAVEPDVGRVAHGVPARVDRLKGLGNAVVPQVAELVGRWVVERLP